MKKALADRLPPRRCEGVTNLGFRLVPCPKRATKIRTNRKGESTRYCAECAKDFDVEQETA